MNLYGSITELQNSVMKLYLNLEQRFTENQLIRELWNAMAHDVSQQIDSLKAFPSSFWSQLKKDRDGLFEAAVEDARRQIKEKTEDLPLKGCFELALSFEEPTILKIYVPIIRSLKENWTTPALNFYIMVKAHLARITRITESFSGDPIVNQRSSLLLQRFEKEIQEPLVDANPPMKKSRASFAVRKRVPAAKGKKVTSRARPLAEHVKMHRRAKPLIKKVELQRRRAHR